MECCSICLEEQNQTKRSFRLSCKHYFHFDCITLHITDDKIKIKCPMCRTIISCNDMNILAKQTLINRDLTEFQMEKSSISKMLIDISNSRDLFIDSEITDELTKNEKIRLLNELKSHFDRLPGMERRIFDIMDELDCIDSNQFYDLESLSYLEIKDIEKQHYDAYKLVQSEINQDFIRMTRKIDQLKFQLEKIV